MASSDSTENQRCCFLELPPEIRLMIYEEVHKVDPPETELTIPTYVSNGAFARHAALTRVSRQIRLESSPVFYRNGVITIRTCKEYDRYHSHIWLKTTGSAVFAVLSSIKTKPRTDCRCGIQVIDGELQVTSICRKCKTLRKYHEIAEKKASQLNTFDGGEVKITKELAQALFELLCSFSKLH